MSNNTIIIRYGEIHLKGKNRGVFEKKLINNIKYSLVDITCKLVVDRGRYRIVDYDINHQNQIVEKLSKVYGIHSISIGLISKSDIDSLSIACINGFGGGSFKVETNRADKSYPLTSYQVSAQVGAKILNSCKDSIVDIHNPKHIFYIDIRSNDYSLVYTQIVKGQGGLPYGTAGRGLLLLSGGIDSPVAGYKISKRGLQLVAVHFWSYPYTSVQAKQKVEKLTLILSNYCPDISLYIVNSTNLQQAIKQYCDDEYIITILRRCMLKIAKQLTIKLNLDCIITGESLGQVASQTLDSLNVSNNAIVDIPILRPLISMDKQEIIEIAKEIDTYQTSILPYEDCCTVFMPKKPIIHPTRDRAILNENKIPNLNELIDEAVNQTLQTTNQKIVKQLN